MDVLSTLAWGLLALYPSLLLPCVSAIRTVVHERAGQIQADVASRPPPMPMGGPAAQLALSMPLRFAGLGILNFQYDAALHFVQGLGTWSEETSRAIGFLERTPGIDVETLAALKPPRRQGRVVRAHFYEALAKQLHEMVLGLAPSGVDVPSQSLHVRYLLAWCVASLDTFLPRGAFRLLGLPTCFSQFLPWNSGVSADLSHWLCLLRSLVHTCAFGPSQLARGH